jgi:hypothetical protein
LSNASTKKLQLNLPTTPLRSRELQSLKQRGFHMDERNRLKSSRVSEDIT